MEITLKNLKNQLSKCTAATVTEVKQFVASKEGCQPEQVKCIYQGKILQDSQDIAALNIQETHYIVYMVNQTKAAPVAKAPKSEPGSPTKPSRAEHQLTPVPPEHSSMIPGMVSGDALKRATDEMKSMGFTETDINKAMRKAFNHPQRAIEYLLSGQLDSVGDVGALSPLPAPEEQPELTEGISTEADEETQMEQLLQLISSNPQMMQQIMGANPQMGQQIMQYLQQVSLQGTNQNGHGQEEMPQAHQDPMQVELTAEDEQKISQLMNLGFSKDQCIEAYLVCGKNEEVAANYLLEHTD